MARRIENLKKVIELKTNDKVYAQYVEDILYINLVQTFTDSVYELYVNLGRHIDKYYGVYQNSKQKRNYKMLKKHIEEIKSTFAKVSQTTTTLRKHTTEEEAEAISNLLLGIADFNVNNIKMYILALLSANINAFLKPESMLKQNSVEKLNTLWDVCKEMANETAIFDLDNIEKPDPQKIIDLDDEYIKTYIKNSEEEGGSNEND